MEIHPLSTHAANKVTEEQIERIIQSIEDIDYGSIEIVIHNSKIVQIEKKEKIRFQK